MKLMRAIKGGGTKVGNVKLHERPEAGTFKLKQEVKARNEAETTNATLDFETNQCHQSGIFGAFTSTQKRIFAHSRHTRALNYPCRSPSRSS